MLMLVMAVQCIATTWTIHGCKDNLLQVSAYSNYVTLSNGVRKISGYEWFSWAWWDYYWDIAFPEYADSGSECRIIGFWSYRILHSNYAYSDVQVICVGEGHPDAPIVSLTEDVWCEAWISGPYPDYAGGLYVIIPVEGGEFWIDFDETGNGRLSTYCSSDFGKWAWDGSINPSWVEPPLAPVERTKRGKGHNK